MMLRAASLADTHAIAAALAGVSRVGDIIVLAGEMGAGKTAFAQGFGRALGVTEPITPAHPLPPLPDIPRGALVVIEGRAPVWRYGIAFHRLHASSAAAVAVYDPRLGAVVVASHTPGIVEGQVFDVTPPA